MTKRDFFRLLIKVFTLYSVVISIFTLFPQLILLNQMLNNAEIVLVYIACLLIVVLISYILVKYTDKIIDFLRLDKEFEAILRDYNVEMQQYNQKLKEYNGRTLSKLWNDKPIEPIKPERRK